MELSIPFGIYHIVSLRIFISVENTFNPFWDLSLHLKSCVEIKPEFLSIPFGIYHSGNVYVKVKLVEIFQSLLGFITISLTPCLLKRINFQSLLGFIGKTTFLKLLLEILAFNPFWDLSSSFFLFLFLLFLSTFNPFWDLSFDYSVRQ